MIDMAAFLAGIRALGGETFYGYCGPRGSSMDVGFRDPAALYQACMDHGLEVPRWVPPMCLESSRTADGVTLRLYMTIVGEQSKEAA